MRAWVGLILLPGMTVGAELGGSNFIPGFYGDFGMAQLGGAGGYLNNFLGYYHVEGSDMLLDMPGLIGVTDWKFLGGRYALAVYPALMYARSGHHAQGGYSDMYIVPLAWSWQSGDWSVLAYQGVVVPSGFYGAQRAANLGRNYWTFDSNVAVTRLFDDGTYELSVNLGVMANTQNNATQYRTGTEFHADYLVGYHPNSAWALGVAGSYYLQTESDSGRGVGTVVDGEVATLGPAVMYTFKAGEREVSVSVKWLREIAANNHALGDYLLVRSIMAF
jgi:hypothetical protein